MILHYIVGSTLFYNSNIPLISPSYPYIGIPLWLNGKEFTCQAGDMSLIFGLGRSPGKELGNPLQYFCLKNPMDRRAWWATAHGGHKRVGHNLATKQQHPFIIAVIYFNYTWYNHCVHCCYYYFKKTAIFHIEEKGKNVFNIYLFLLEHSLSL